MKKTYGKCALRIAVGILILGLLLASSAGAATLTVCKSGCAYSSIQDAVNAASSGDTILVQNGTYYENVNVNKQLTLRGIGMPVVDSRGSGSAITLSANRVKLEGFTAVRSDPEAGIKVYSNNNTLIGNNASSNNKWGIILLGKNNTLSGNNAWKNSHGIAMSGNNNTLSGNNASSNNGYGIYLYSSYNTLSGNNASNNQEGISLRYTSSSNRFSSNNISNNYYGISLGYSESNNNIYNNVFNNINNIYIDTSARNTWNTTGTFGINIIEGPYLGGNYWANPDETGFSQTCEDADNDGICDSPYTFNSNNIDYLPLAYKPFNILKGDLNNNGVPADSGDLVLMKHASIGEIQADSRYDLNNNGQLADAGDLVLMKRASIGEINLTRRMVRIPIS